MTADVTGALLGSRGILRLPRPTTKAETDPLLFGQLWNGPIHWGTCELVPCRCIYADLGGLAQDNVS